MATNEKASKTEQSDPSIALFLAVLISAVGSVFAGWTSQNSYWTIVSLFFSLVVCLQAYSLRRSFIVQIPFLASAIMIAPEVAVILGVQYVLLTPIFGRNGFPRLASILIGEILAGLTLYFLRQIQPPEIWIASGVVYLAIRTLISRQTAKWTGLPLDYGAISGISGFWSSVAYLLVASCIFYFDRFEVTLSYCFQMLLLSLGWIAILRAYQAASATFQNGLVSIGNLLNYAHPYTGGHSRRVAYLARETGRRLGIPEWKLDDVVHAAMLHDVGKLAVDERILEKPGRLTDEEFAVIKTHPVVGEKIVESIAEVRNFAPWIRHHHERLDGRGYPDNLPHREIPIESRLIAVLDAYDAMTGSSADGHRRLYRDPISSDAAIEELQRCVGTQFDPVVVSAFTRVVRFGQKETE